MADRAARPLDDEQIERAAQLLLTARTTGVHLDRLPDGLEPLTANDGYRIQRAGHALSGGPLGPWKVGATSIEAQRILGVDGPFTGRPPSNRVFPSGSTLAVGDLFMAMPAIEVEIGLVPKSDLDSLPADAMELAPLVDVAPALEFVDSRLSDMTSVGVATLIADNAVASAIVAGSPAQLSADEVLALDRVDVELQVDGGSVVSGHGAMALGHPLNVLHFAATHALQQGTLIRAGELVITGTCTGIFSPRPGMTATGRVGHLTVSATLE